MGKTWTIHPKRRKNLNLSRKYKQCKLCNNKVSRFHHSLCDKCWKENNRNKYGRL